MPSDKKIILIVDDSPQNLMVLSELLQHAFEVRAANSGERALRVATRKPLPDLILLDIMMPDMDGYQVLQHLREDPEARDIPVIFITAMAEAQDEQHGLELGAVDYITKPFNPAIVLQRVNTQLELKAARDRLAQENRWLDAEVKRRMRENLLVQELTMQALACIGEARDNETGLHIARTQGYMQLLVERLVDQPRYAEALAGEAGQRIVKAAPLHDLGKVGIPDAILLKPGRLTEQEFEVMKQHPRIGAEAIDRAMRLSLTSAGGETELADSAFAALRVARDISLSHHEKWDGTGYPEGLAGEAIPLSARLMALADVFDALITKRVYKPAYSLEQTTQIIIDGRGRHFDPHIVDAYLALRHRFAEVAAQYADEDPL